MSEERDEAGVFGFQPKLPRTYSGISNPRMKRSNSNLAEDYYKTRNEIANKIRQATPKMKVAYRSKTKPKGKLRGTNLTAASGATMDSMDSLGTFASTVTDLSADSENSKSECPTVPPNYSRVSRRPSLSNTLGKTEFKFENDFEEKSKRIKSQATTLTNGFDDFSLGGYETEDEINQTLRDLHVVSDGAVKSSYKNLMNGKLDIEETESECSQSQHIRKKMTPKKKMNGNAETLGVEKLGSGKRKPPPELKNMRPNLVGSNDQFAKLGYHNDLDPETLRTSLREIASDSENKKLVIKAARSGKKPGKKKSRRQTGAGCTIC